MPSLFRRSAVLFAIAGWLLGAGAAAQDEAGDVAPAPAAEVSPLLVEPRTAEEFFRAALLMSDVGRPNLARRYLEGFVALEPDDELLMGLRDQHGPTAFLQLARNPAVQPVAGPLLRRVNEILRRRDADPVRLDALLDALQGTPAQRADALRTIENIGAIVVPRIVLRLGSPAAEGQTPWLIYALARIGRDAVLPLVAALESPDPNVRVAAIDALGRIGDERAVPYLWSPAFAAEQPEGVRAAARTALARIRRSDLGSVDAVSPYGAADRLVEQALEHLRYEAVWPVAEDGRVEFWTWNPAAATVQTVPLTPEAASLYTGTRLARQALLLSPENARVQAVYFALALASQVDRNVPGAPLPTGPGTVYNLALTAGADVVLDSLDTALRTGNEAAAVAALQVAGQVATRDVLHRGGGTDSPVVAALNYPDADVQFAAAVAILQLDPQRTFPHSGRVVPILTRALNDAGSPVALVIDPNAARGSGIAGMLGETGLTAEVVTSGRRGFITAAERGDVELIAIQAYIVDWPLSQTIANLRADARTAAIPIVVYGPDAVQAKLDPLRLRHQRLTLILEPETPTFLRQQLRPLLASLRSPALTNEQRAARRAAAVYWLAYLAEGQRPRIFDLSPAAEQLVIAAADPALAANAVLALGGVGTAGAQSQLQQIALSPALAAATRETAALQLAFHIQRYGLLLTREEVADLRTAWVASTEPAVATALASVVGSLKPSTRSVTVRIEQSAPVVVPLPASLP